MYVEVLTPRRPRSRYPLVLIHGAAQTATNWMGTPDGRPGWADYFVGQGYTVYMVDQPARGRSPVRKPVGVDDLTHIGHRERFWHTDLSFATRASSGNRR